MEFYEASGIDEVIYYVQLHLTQAQEAIRNSGSTNSVVSLLNHTHRYIEKVKEEKLSQLKDMAKHHMESQNYHEQFERMRLEQEQAFIHEMLEKYAKLAGVDLARLKEEPKPAKTKSVTKPTSKKKEAKK